MHFVLYGFVVLLLLIFNPFANIKMPETKPTSSNHPVGTFMYEYTGDSDGNRVDELNEVDFKGRKTDSKYFLNTMSVTEAFTINEDGTGTYKTGVGGIVERKVTFYDDYFETEGGTQIAYKYDDNKIWTTYEIKEKGTDIPNSDEVLAAYDAGEALSKYAPWEKGETLTGSTVFIKTTSEYVDLAFDGKGGSVPIKDAEIGDLVCIGNFETFPGNNKTEPIFWRVIDKKDGKLFILSEKVIDNYAFNNKREESDTTTWETSTLRSFLNGDFLTTCFTEDEQKMIQTTHLTNEACNEELHAYWGDLHDLFEDGVNKTYSEINKQNQKDGNETDDKIFVLSVKELMHYFPLGSEKPTAGDGVSYPFTEFVRTPEMIAKITEAAEDNGDGFYDRETLGGAYLTRTLSDSRNQVVYVSGDGQFFQYYNFSPLFLRPAMWISAE